MIHSGLTVSIHIEVVEEEEEEEVVEEEVEEVGVVVMSTIHRLPLR